MSPLRLDFQVSKEMTDSTSNKGTWGAFTPVMPAFVRLVAGVIVLVILEAVILGFPGIAYKSYRAWTPLLAYFFQIVAIGILYAVTNPIAQPYFTSQPWAFPLIFLLIALIPTLKVVVNIVHGLEGGSSSSTKHAQSQNY